MKSLLNLEAAGFGNSPAALPRSGARISAPPAASFKLTPDEVRNCRHRIERFQARTPAAELAALRVKLEQIENTCPVNIVLRSDCLKAIGTLALKLK